MLADVLFAPTGNIDGMAVHAKPQARLTLSIRTVALFLPTSAEKKFERPSLAFDTLSPSKAATWMPL
jgi:hypothetical protein